MTNTYFEQAGNYLFRITKQGIRTNKVDYQQLMTHA